MISKFIEVTNEEHGRKFNHGKFMVARFSHEEWARRSTIEETRTMPLLHMTGWSDKHVMVFDLQTGEGAMFRPGGFAQADLNQHKVWVCPMFEPFLEWLYLQKLDDLTTLPALVHLANAPSSMAGYRRKGPNA